MVSTVACVGPGWGRLLGQVFGRGFSLSAEKQATLILPISTQDALKKKIKNTPESFNFLFCFVLFKKKEALPMK